MPASSSFVAVSVAVLCEIAIGCASANPRQLPAEESTLTAADIERHPNEPVEKLLQAKAPGLTIRRADDGSIAVVIRGAHSFTGTDAPLYLLDGMPFTPGADGVLSGVDPHSIESIKVLRGSEVALYGIQGMNGVIAISTKKPVKPLPR